MWDVASRYTCSEADDVALGLLGLVGEDAAIEWLAAHATGGESFEEEGDLHYDSVVDPDTEQEFGPAVLTVNLRRYLGGLPC
jgi:hypothetical protein